MRVVVTGLGSIGRRHVRNLRSIDSGIHIVAWRHAPGPVPDDVLCSLERVVYSQVEALACQPDFAIIATTSAIHAQAALAFARAGVHLFVEKPLSDQLDAVDELLDECEKRGLVLMVGYNLRFDRALRTVREAMLANRIGRVLALRAEVGQYLPDWRPEVDYRRTGSAERCLGGGAVLELSHELDYVSWLLGQVQWVSAHLFRLSDLEIDVEDTAELTLQFAGGAIASLHLDMVQRAATRTCRLIGTGGTLTWDGLAGDACLFSEKAGGWTTLCSGRSGQDSYVEEMRHFIDCVTHGRQALVDGADGRRVLEIVAAVRRSAMLGSIVHL